MIPIRNFGMLWERKYIYYGRQGVKGSLLGYNSRIEKVDFRDQIGVYVLYDKDMHPVYVGQTGIGSQKLFDRLKQHEVDHLWNRWDYFSWFGFREVARSGTLSIFDKSSRKVTVKIEEALNEIEGVLIMSLEPKLNKQGAKFPKVEEFYQEYHEEVEETTNEDLYDKQEEILSKIDKLLKRIK